jgi:hypothetical protein
MISMRSVSDLPPPTPSPILTVDEFLWYTWARNFLFLATSGAFPGTYIGVFPCTRHRIGASFQCIRHRIGEFPGH